MLKLDFSQEEEWLNESISESGTKDGGDDGDSCARSSCWRLSSVD